MYLVSSSQCRLTKRKYLGRPGCVMAARLDSADTTHHPVLPPLDTREDSELGQEPAVLAQNQAWGHKVFTHHLETQ